MTINKSGSVAVIFAVFLCILAGTAGAAVDYLRAYRSHTMLQKALDVAVLALAADPDHATAEHANVFFKTNAIDSSIAAVTPTVAVSPDGTVSLKATVQLETSLLRLLGIPTISVTTESAARKPAGTPAFVVNFTANAVKGWYAKDIYAFTRDEDGKIVEEVKVLSYDYDYATDTHTVSPEVSTVTGDFTLDKGKTFGLKMRVWPAYPKKGSSRYATKPVDYFSDAPNAYMKKSGNCATGESHFWEDAPNRKDPSQDDFLDFVYTMTCKSWGGDTSVVRLTK